MISSWLNAILDLLSHIPILTLEVYKIRLFLNIAILPFILTPKSDLKSIYARKCWSASPKILDNLAVFSLVYVRTIRYVTMDTRWYHVAYLSDLSHKLHKLNSFSEHFPIMDGKLLTFDNDIIIWVITLFEERLAFYCGDSLLDYTRNGCAGKRWSIHLYWLHCYVLHCWYSFVDGKLFTFDNDIIIWVVTLFEEVLAFYYGNSLLDYTRSGCAGKRWYIHLYWLTCCVLHCWYSFSNVRLISIMLFILTYALSTDFLCLLSGCCQVPIYLIKLAVLSTDLASSTGSDGLDFNWCYTFVTYRELHLHVCTLKLINICLSQFPRRQPHLVSSIYCDGLLRVLVIIFKLDPS